MTDVNPAPKRPAMIDGPRVRPAGVLEFRVLGPIEAYFGGTRLPVTAGRQRSLLGLLLLDCDRAISTTRIVDGLWGARPPAGAEHAIEVYVSRLRAQFRASGADATVAKRGNGYVLKAPPATVDAHRFETLLLAGRAAHSRGRPDDAFELLSQALQLWRGRPLEDAELEGTTALSESSRLEELRLQAVEERIDAQLALGRHRSVVADLEQYVSEEPLREHLRAQLMLALYRSGRQAEALAVYRRTRETLVEQFGIDPMPELRSLEQAILRQDAELDPPTDAWVALSRVEAIPLGPSSSRSERLHVVTGRGLRVANRIRAELQGRATHRRAGRS